MLDNAKYCVYAIRCKINGRHRDEEAAADGTD